MSSIAAEGYTFISWDHEQETIQNLSVEESLENLMEIKHILEVGRERALLEQQLGEGKTSDDEDGTTRYLDFLAQKIIYYNVYLTQINASINRFNSKGGGRRKKKTRKKKGGRRKTRKKKTRKMRGGDLNDIKVGSIIGSRYNDNWTHTLGRSTQKWRVVEIEKKPMYLNGIAFVRLRPVNDKGTATGPKTDIIAFWRLQGMFDIVPETKFDIQSRTASGGRRKKKSKRRKVNCGSITVKLKYKSRN